MTPEGWEMVIRGSVAKADRGNNDAKGFGYASLVETAQEMQ